MNSFIYPLRIIGSINVAHVVSIKSFCLLYFNLTLFDIKFNIILIIDYLHDCAVLILTILRYSSAAAQLIPAYADILRWNSFPKASALGLLSVVLLLGLLSVGFYVGDSCLFRSRRSTFAHRGLAFHYAVPSL